jgi:predicted DNA-binding transcriptional regulator AlpA
MSEGQNVQTVSLELKLSSASLWGDNIRAQVKMHESSHSPNGPNHLLQLLRKLSEKSNKRNGVSMNGYMSFPQIAEDLGVPLRTIYFLNQQGQGPKAIKIGRTFRVAVEDYESWKSENTH